jgi:3'(2'), 5'-bisphosphate nucleotidase
VTPAGTPEREVALEAVRSAARLAGSVRASFALDLAASKPDRSPVTVADLGAQVLVSLALSTAFPTDPLVGEEDASQLSSAPIREALLARLAESHSGLDARAVADALDRGGSRGGPTGRWWTLDPVDGTLGFLRGGQYAIALALIEDGSVRLGVLGCPALHRADGSVGSLFVAEHGAGAWEMPLDGEAEPVALTVAGCTSTTEARYAESLEPAHSAQDEAARIGELLGVTAPPLRLDSQAKYALVARGDASIYLRIPRHGYVENIWDHAAGSILVEEAGGIVTDVDGRALDWGCGRRLERNRGIIAAPAAIHAEVVAAAGEVLPARVA